MPDLSVKFRDYSFIGCQEIHEKRSSLTLAGSLGHCACAVSRDLRVRGQKRPHIWNHRPQFVDSLYNFYGATMMIKITLLSGVPIVSDFQSKIFSPFFRQKSTFGRAERG